MVSALLSRCLILILGTLYPAYKSYKAIKNKDVREHVKWMMYWIVFALFTTLETFLDIFFSWFPFYYEIKILFILWVLSPATRGSSMLYKKVVHPMLTSREKEIDDLIEKTKSQGYNTFLQLFSSGFQYASNLFVNSAIKGHLLLGNKLGKSLSMNDVYDGVNGNTNNNNNNPILISDHDNFKMPNALIDDDEDDDFDAENEKIRRLNNKIIYDSSVKNATRKQSLQQLNGNSNVYTNGTNGSSREYEIVDDIDDLDKKYLASKKRTSSRQMSVQSNLMTAGTSGSYKTAESSHFGTITRGTTRRTKNSVTTLNAQNDYFDNDI